MFFANKKNIHFLFSLITGLAILCFSNGLFGVILAQDAPTTSDAGETPPQTEAPAESKEPTPPLEAPDDSSVTPESTPDNTGTAATNADEKKSVDTKPEENVSTEKETGDGSGTTEIAPEDGLKGLPGDQPITGNSSNGFPSGGESKTIKILPSALEGGSGPNSLLWENAAQALIQDLPEDAALSQFSTENSAKLVLGEKDDSSIVFSGFDAGSGPEIQIVESAQLRLSFAANIESAGALDIGYKFKDQPSVSLGSINIDKTTSNKQNGGYFLFSLPAIRYLSDLADVRITLTAPKNDPKGELFLESIWIEASYKDKKNDAAIKEKKEKANKVLPELKFKVKKQDFKYSLWEKLMGFFLKRDRTVKAVLIDPEGREKRDGLSFVGDELDIKSLDMRSYRPGLYKVRIITTEGDKTAEQDEEFAQGVLAINTDKSVYLENETAYIQMAALNDVGFTDCGANLSVEITDPDGKTSNPDIQRSGLCDGNNITNTPDYFTHYQTGVTGTYSLKLTNQDTGNTISDSFVVYDKLPFDIQRTGPTRINPTSPYRMQIKVRSNENYKGLVSEYVPGNFAITGEGFSQTPASDSTELTWEVDWLEGETHVLSYEFDAPDVSPLIYLLGPFKIGNFSEIRQWQIAADAQTNTTCNYTGANNGSWDNSGNWDCGVVPNNVSCTNTSSGTCYWVNIANGANVNIDSSTSFTVSGITVGGSSNTGSLSITNTGTLTVQNAGNAPAQTPAFTMGLVVVGTSSYAGTLNLNPSTAQTCLTTTISANVTTTGANGTITSSNSNCTWYETSTAAYSVTNEGTMSGYWSMSFNFRAGLINASTGTINMSGGAFLPSNVYFQFANNNTAANSVTFYDFTVVTTSNYFSGTDFTVTHALTISSSMSLTMTSGTVTFTGGSIVNNSSLTFYNLTIDGTVSTEDNFTIRGALTVGASGNLSPTAGTITMDYGTWRIYNSGTLAFYGLSIGQTPGAQTSSSFSIASSLYLYGATLSPTGGTITFTGGTITNNSGILNFYSLTVDGTITANINFSVAAALIVTASGNLSPTTGLATMKTAEWTISNSGTLVFHDWTVAKTPNTQTSANFSLGGVLTVNSGVTLAPSAGTITMTGGSITNSGALTFYNLTVDGSVATSSSFSVANNISGTGSAAFSASGGTVTLTDASISNTGSLIFYSLTINGTVTTSSDFSIRNDLTIGATGNLSPSGGEVSFIATTYSIINSGILEFYGVKFTSSVSVGTTATFSVSNSLSVNTSVTFHPSAGTITMTGGSISNSGTIYFYNLNIAGTVTTDATFYIHGQLSVTASGNFSASAGTINLTEAAWTITNDGFLQFYDLYIGITPTNQSSASYSIFHLLNVPSSRQFLPAGGTITFSGPNSTLTNGSTTEINFHGLTVAESSTLTVSGAINVLDTMTVGANAVFIPPTNKTIDGASGILTGSGTIKVNYATGGTGLTSQYTINTLDLSNLTVDFCSTVAQTINALTYKNLIIEPAADSITDTMAAGTTTVTGNLTLGNGINATSTITASTNDPNISVAGNMLVKTNTTFTNTDNAAKTLNIDGNLTIDSGGKFTAPNGTSASTFTLGGDFSNSGTYTHSSGRITLDGNGGANNQTLSGTTTPTTFYQLYITAGGTRSVYFADGIHYAIANNGTLNLAGTSSFGLTLTRSGTSSAWYLDVSATGTTVSVSYVTASWSDASGGIEIDASNGTNTNGLNNTHWLFALNAAPLFTANTPHEDGTSDSTTPTNIGSNVTFKATATDSNGNQWYLAVCKTNAIAANNDAAPTCTGGSWQISSLTDSGSEATASYTATSTETGESYNWYAFACDKTATSPACSAMSNSGTSGNNGSPFAVNHPPTFNSQSNNGPKDPGATLTITASGYSEPDNDSVSLYVCKTAGFTAGGSPACNGSEWCHATGVIPMDTLACDLSIPNPQAHGSVNYFPYMVDGHGLAASGGRQGASVTFNVSNKTPVVSGTPTLNDTQAINLTNEKDITNIYVKGTISDDNGCADIVAGHTYADAWLTSITRANCAATSSYDGNNCYYDDTSTCVYDATIDSCDGGTDKTAGFKCTIPFQYYANPTDAGTPWENDSWTASFYPGDGEDVGSPINTATVEMNSFLAMGLATNYDSISYGAMDGNGVTDPLLEKTRVEATGNCSLNVNLSGSAMTGPGTAIPIANQRYGLGSGAPAWSSGTELSASSTLAAIGVCKSGYTAAPEWGKIWWGISIPAGQASGVYTGTNTIEAVERAWSQAHDWCE